MTTSPTGAGRAFWDGWSTGPTCESAFLKLSRHVEVWLPPGYDEAAATRYPVLYMHDGQNLFDPRIANTGVDWGVDEAVVRLVKRGVIPPVIVVGAWSTDAREPEYSPWDDASDYARFLIEELMPRVNREFRTRTGPANTAAMGSSMGGLLSFYLVTHHPEVFGACGCVSTHFPLSEAVAAQVFRNFTPTGVPDTTPYVYPRYRGGPASAAGAPGTGSTTGRSGSIPLYAPTHGIVRDWLLGRADRGPRLRHPRLSGRHPYGSFLAGAAGRPADFPVRTAAEVRPRRRAILPLLLLIAACAPEPAANAPAQNLSVPAWSGDAIWYQVFVERFRNGDPGNDPTAHDIERRHRPAAAGRLAADAVVPGLVSPGAVGRRHRQGLLRHGAVPPLRRRPPGTH